MVRTLLSLLMVFVVFAQPAHASTVTLTFVGAAPTTETSGDSFPLTILAADANGPVSQLLITPALASGSPGATIEGFAPAATDLDGEANFSLKITGPAGDYTLSFSAPGATTRTTTIAITAVPRLILVARPSPFAESGTALEEPPIVRVTQRDGGTPAIAMEGIEVTVSLPPGSPGTLTGTTKVTSDSEGEVIFGLTITGPAGDYTLSFRAPGASTIEAPPITVTVAPEPNPPPDPVPNPVPNPTPAPSPAPQTLSPGTTTISVGMLTLVLPDNLVCTTTSDSDQLWIQLPSAQECSFVGGPALTPQQLIGWATTPDFPRSIVLRQIDNNWGSYQMENDDGHITAVYFRAGGWAVQSSPSKLYALIDARR